MKRSFFVLVFSLVFASPAFASYPDVKESDWYAPYVEELSQAGIVEGYSDGRFGSWDPVNRAELSKIIVNLQKNLREEKEPFWKEYFFELILLGVTVAGWIAVILIAKRPITVNCPYHEKQEEVNLPPAGVAPLTNPKNQTTNWWL